MAHGHSKAFPARDTDHIIQHVMHAFAVEHAPSSVKQECWRPQNSQVEAITNALGQRWERQRRMDRSRLNMENKFVYRKLELGEIRASSLMYNTTHWRANEDTSAVGTTTLNRVAAGHRIEEQNRVLFEHLLNAPTGVVSNAALKDRAKRLDAKLKTMSHFKPQQSFPVPPLPRSFPIDEGLDDERNKNKLPPIHSSSTAEDVDEFRERSWVPMLLRDVRTTNQRRDDRLRGLEFSPKNAATSRTLDHHGWCNRETSHQNWAGGNTATTRNSSARGISARRFG